MYKIELYEKELQRSKRGKEIHTIITRHMKEVMNLINHNREVMLVWQRNKGPLFFSDTMGSGFNTDIKIKKEVQGVSYLSLLRRMAVALQDNGSRDLKKDIDAYYLLVMQYAQSCDSLHEIFEKLRNNE